MIKESICFIGDQHGNIQNLFALMDYVEQKHDFSCYFQVGDFGLMGNGFQQYLKKINKRLIQSNKIMYFIDGNHENHSWLAKQKLNHEHFSEIVLTSNIIYLPRGTVKNISGFNILAVGGAFSVDRVLRQLGKDYWEEETISNNEFDKIVNHLKKNPTIGKIDLMVSHDHPTSFNIVYCKQFGDFSYYRQSDYYVDMIHKNFLMSIWELVGRPNIISGHYHKKETLHYDGSSNIILNRDGSDFEEQYIILENK